MIGDDSSDEHYMGLAIRLAQQAYAGGEVPVGAVIVRDGRVVGRAHNQVELLRDPTAHAEIIAITQAASAIEDWRLADTVLYVTKEPCPMCAGAVVNARIPRIVWGVDDPERGGARSAFSILDHDRAYHRCDMVSGVRGDECRDLLVSFFREAREKK